MEEAFDVEASIATFAELYYGTEFKTLLIQEQRSELVAIGEWKEDNLGNETRDIIFTAEVSLPPILERITGARPLLCCVERQLTAKRPKEGLHALKQLVTSSSTTVFVGAPPGEIDGVSNLCNAVKTSNQKVMEINARVIAEENITGKACRVKISASVKYVGRVWGIGSLAESVGRKNAAVTVRVLRKLAIEKSREVEASKRQNSEMERRTLPITRVPSETLCEIQRNTTNAAVADSTSTTSVAEKESNIHERVPREHEANKIADEIRHIRRTLAANRRNPPPLKKVAQLLDEKQTQLKLLASLERRVNESFRRSLSFTVLSFFIPISGLVAAIVLDHYKDLSYVATLPFFGKRKIFVVIMIGILLSLSVCGVATMRYWGRTDDLVRTMIRKSVQKEELVIRKTEVENERSFSKLGRWKFMGWNKRDGLVFGFRAKSV